MKVLIACEFSGMVREAFRKVGADAWSCDLLPTEIPGQHIMDDVRNVLDYGWDLMIAHPPCTYLSYAGIAHWNQPGRAEKRRMAAEFFMHLWNAPIDRIALENPVGHMNTVWRKPDQTIHPYYFGDRQLKKTCLWLKNLPLLGKMQYTAMPEPDVIHVRRPSKNYQGGEIKKRYFTDRYDHIENGHERSRTFTGIANAMAEQWSSVDIPLQLTMF